MAGYKIRVAPKKYREPDLIYMTAEQNAQAGEDFTDRADLVMEVVSPDDPDRDYVTKREQYAQAGVPEYWIVDPLASVISVLHLEDGRYIESGKFVSGQIAKSRHWNGFGAPVGEILKGS